MNEQSKEKEKKYIHICGSSLKIFFVLSNLPMMHSHDLDKFECLISREKFVRMYQTIGRRDQNLLNQIFCRED